MHLSKRFSSFRDRKLLTSFNIYIYDAIYEERILSDRRSSDVYYKNKVHPLRGKVNLLMGI